MAVSFEALMYGISIQETGGRKDAYSIVNSIGAVGKYQVMKANIPSWSKRVLGYSITWQKFRDSPDLQEKIVRGILKGYYNQYGAGGAAAMWYSGQPNTSKTYGNPPVYQYVNSVLNHSKSYTGKSSSGGGGGGGGGGGKEPKEKSMTKDERAVYYGFSYAFFSMNKELKDLLDRASKEDWTKEKFTAEFMDTKWYRSLSGDERKFIAMKKADPKSAKAKLDAAYVHVRQLANQMGLRETPGNKKKLDLWAYNAAAKGWTDEQLRNEIGKYVYFNDDTWQGEGGETQEKLRSYAYSMGVDMSSQWYADKSRNVIRKIGTQQDYEDEIRRKAKAQYSYWGKQIDAGQSVMDLASPYLQSMSQILELPAGSINLFDPTIKKSLQYRDPTTGKGAAKPLWQFENELRNDSRWKKTKNAQDSLMQVAHQILTDFGIKT